MIMYDKLLLPWSILNLFMFYLSKKEDHDSDVQNQIREQGCITILKKRHIVGIEDLE